MFQGGALESELLAITEFSETEWHKFRVQLEAKGLIKAEALTHLGIDYPFLKFHPTFAPSIWSRLTEPEQQQLLIRHRQCYYQLSIYLHFEDDKNPFFTRAISKRELPNFLYAVRGSITAGENFAVDFMSKVNKFLYFFGLNQDRENLADMARYMGSGVDSQTWFLTQSNTGEQLWSTGRYTEAEAVFQDILRGLGATPSYQRCITLNRLGRCYRSTGQTEQAAATYRLGLEVAGLLEQTNSMKRNIGGLQTDLGDVLTDMGDYDRARESYEASLAIDKELGDLRGEAVVKQQMGTLALVQKRLTEAVQHYQEALQIFQQLNEPAAESAALHQMGRTFEESRQWEAAEQMYRQSAQIKESQGDLAKAAMTWHHLAIISEDTGKLKEAEEWYRKAIDVGRKTGNCVLLSQHLTNLANLIQQLPDRLNEAQQLADESLSISQTLDPTAIQIWATYNFLAEISDKQGKPAKAKEYRRQSRAARANFAGLEHELSRHVQLIDSVVRAVENAKVRQELEPVLENMISCGWHNLITSIRKILNGQRDEDILCEGLDYQDYEIIIAILHGIESK